MKSTLARAKELAAASVATAASANPDSPGGAVVGGTAYSLRDLASALNSEEEPVVFLFVFFFLLFLGFFVLCCVCVLYLLVLFW